MTGEFTIRHFRYAIGAFVVALALGAIAFALTLDAGPLDAIYRSTVTISLTGLDTRPDSTGAEVTTIVLILGGMAIYAYIAGSLVELVARGVLTGSWSDRRRLKMIDGLRDHYIICGYGRVGRRWRTSSGAPACPTSSSTPTRRLSPRLARTTPRGSKARARKTRISRLQASSTRAASSPLRAPTPTTCTSPSPRGRSRPNLLIVARASDPDAARKLQRAGADRVTQPFSIAGNGMAKLVLRPQVAAFLDVVTSSAGPDIRLDEIEVTPHVRARRPDDP